MTYDSKTAQEVIDLLMKKSGAGLSGNHNPDYNTLAVIKLK